MKAGFLGFVMLLLAGSAGFAQTTILKPGEALRGRFTQERFLTGFEKPAVSEGTFLLAGQGLVWRGETPFPVTTVITAFGIVQLMDGKERMRLSADKAPFLARLHQTMSGVMAGDWQKLHEDFTLRESAEGDARILDLAPRAAGENQPIRAIRIVMRRFVDEVVIVKPSGDRDRIAFFAHALGPAALTPDEAALLGTR